MTLGALRRCIAAVLLSVGTAVILGQAAAASVKPEALLRRALATPRVAFDSLQRTRVHTETGSTVSAVTVRADGKGAVRREFASGPAAGVIVIQREDATWQRKPGGTWVRMPTAAQTDPDDAAAMIVANYTVTATAGQKLLGRKATKLTITARRTFNPSRRLWVDDATGVILRDDLVAPAGRPRSTTAVTRFRLSRQPPDLFAPPAGAPDGTAGFGPGSFSSRTGRADVERETGREIRLPGHVPDGYRVASYGVMTTGSGLRTPAVHYSDGLAAFTVFQRGQPAGGGFGWRRGGRQGAGPRGPGRRGGGGGPPWAQNRETVDTDRQRTMVMIDTRQFSYVVIGDLAEAELVAVARSLP